MIQSFITCFRYVLIAAILISSSAFAQQVFPTRPVTIVISVVPGGGVDVTARQLAKSLSELWGQAVVVENKPGAGGIVAATIVMRSAADGHTLFLAHNGDISSTAALYNRPDYQPLTQLTPITQVLSQPYVAVVNPSVPAKNIAELIELIKDKNSKGQKYSYATGSLGSAEHLAGEQFRLASGVNMQAIPYKSSAPAITDVAGGHVPFGFFSLATATPLTKAGAVRMLGISTEKRLDIWPAVPTVAETLPGYSSRAWYGFFGPAGMSSELTEKINRAIHAAVNSPSLKTLMHGNGQSAALSTPAEFIEFLRVDIARTSDYIQKANITAQ